MSLLNSLDDYKKNSNDLVYRGNFEGNSEIVKLLDNMYQHESKIIKCFASVVNAALYNKTMTFELSIRTLHELVRDDVKNTDKGFPYKYFRELKTIVRTKKHCLVMLREPFGSRPGV
jgi:hypothetical protein